MTPSMIGPSVPSSPAASMWLRISIAKSHLDAFSPVSLNGSRSSTMFLTSSEIEMNVSCPALFPSAEAPVNVPVERIGLVFPALSTACAA